MDYWTWHGSTISHIPTIGWALIEDGEEYSFEVV